MDLYEVDPKDLDVNNIGLRPSSFAEPLIEVCSVTITPFEAYDSCLIYGEIYVVDSGGDRIYIYNRGMDNPETITSGGPGSLWLTDPGTGVIKMDGSLSMVIKLKVQGLGLKSKEERNFFGKSSHSTNEFGRCAFITRGAAQNRSNRFINYDVMKGQGLPKTPTQGRNAWFAKGCFNLDTTAELCYAENKCLTFKGDLGHVCVKYISMPCALIAEVTVVITQEGRDSDAEYVDDDNARIGRPDAYISAGNITADYVNKYGQIIRSDSDPSLILYTKKGRRLDRVDYGVPIKLRRSLVCVPSYSSLLIRLDNIVLKRGKANESTVFSGVFGFEVAGGGPFSERMSMGDVRATLRVRWFTSDQPDIILRKGNCLKDPQSLSRLQPASASSICRSVSPKKDIPDANRIQILSFVVGLRDKEEVDIYGTVAVEYSMGSCYIFKKDEKNPENLSGGKALSLEGLTSYSLDNFCMRVKLKDLKGHVDIENWFGMYYYDYMLPGQWFDRPICYVLSGKQRSFAAVHFIVFKSAVKATVKIRVIAKDSTNSTASCSWPFVNGSVVAQYSNHQYSTNYQRKYWRIVLFEEENACCLSKEGELSLSRNVISVPTDSSLIFDVDLYASSGIAAGSDGCVDHFPRKVEIRFGDDESQKIVGQTFDVVVSTKWESGRK